MQEKGSIIQFSEAKRRRNRGLPEDELRLARIERLRRRIATGEYEIRTDILAEKLLGAGVVVDPAAFAPAYIE